MRQKTVLSKITRPALPRVLSRERLFRVLDSDAHPVAWITGAAGSGKTTLAASYLDNRNLPCLWYDVGPEDADIATFFYYMGQAARRAAPRIRRPLPLLSPEYQFGIPAFTLRYFEDFFSRVKKPFVLVFDNYHEVPSGAPFHQVILGCLSALPTGIRVLLISRSDPPPCFARFQANRMMTIVGWDQLRLTPGETSGVINLHEDAASCERAGRTRKAVEWYLRGLDVDDLAEELYLGLMQAYRKLGRRGEAVKAYERCRTVLAASLGIAPSQEVEQLRRQIGGPR